VGLWEFFSGGPNKKIIFQKGTYSGTKGGTLSARPGLCPLSESCGQGNTLGHKFLTRYRLQLPGRVPQGGELASGGGGRERRFSTIKTVFAGAKIGPQQLEKKKVISKNRPGRLNLVEIKESGQGKPTAGFGGIPTHDTIRAP